MRLRLLVLGALGGVAILVLAVAHARWLEVGPQDPRFVRFLRRHARRANAEAVLPPRMKSSTMRTRQPRRIWRVPMYMVFTSPLAVG